MENSVLLPIQFRKIGLILVGISILMIIADYFGGLKFLEDISVLAVYNSGVPFDQNEGAPHFFQIIKDDFRFEMIVVLALVGLLFFGFSKRKNEDELVQKIRLNALLWATYAHFTVFILFTIFTFGIFYLNFLLIGVFTILVIYILRFEYKMFQLNKNTE